MQQNNQSKKVLLKITDLKQWFPIKKTKLFQKEQLYVRANDGITLDIYGPEQCMKEIAFCLWTFLISLYHKTDSRTYTDHRSNGEDQIIYRKYQIQCCNTICSYCF